MIHSMGIVIQHSGGSTYLPHPQLLDGFLFLENFHRIWRWIPLYTEFFPSKFSVPNSPLLLPQLKHTDKPCSSCYANFSTFSLSLFILYRRDPQGHCKLSVFIPRAYAYHSFVYSLYKHHKYHISHFSFYLDIFKLSCSSPFSINTDTKNWDQHLRQH